jgi:hypothetical protein
MCKLTVMNVKVRGSGFRKEQMLGTVWERGYGYFIFTQLTSSKKRIFPFPLDTANTCN